MISYKKSKFIIVIVAFLLTVSATNAIGQFIGTTSKNRVQADSSLIMAIDKTKLSTGDAATATITYQSEIQHSDKIIVPIPIGLTIDEEKTKQLNDGIAKDLIWNSEKAQFEISSIIEGETTNNFKVALIANDAGNYQLSASLANLTAEPVELSVEDKLANLDATSQLEPSLLDTIITPYSTPTRWPDYINIMDRPGVKLVEDNTDYVIPGKNSFVMQLYPETTYVAVGEGITDNTGNTDSDLLWGYVFSNTSQLTDPTAERYVLAQKIGKYRGKWVDTKIFIDEVITANPKVGFGVATPDFSNKDVQYQRTNTYGNFFMAVGTPKNSSRNDQYKYHYEFFDNETGNKITNMSGMWNFQNINELKQTDIKMDSKHMSSLFATSSATIEYREDEPSDADSMRLWGTSVSIPNPGLGTYVTTLFDDISEYPITMTSQTGGGINGMIVMYNQAPLVRIFPTIPEVIGTRTEENPMRLKYEILQSVPAQLAKYYAKSFELTSELPAEYDFDLTSLVVKNELDGAIETALFTPSYGDNGASKNKLVLTANDSASTEFNGKTYRVFVEATPNNIFNIAEYLGGNKGPRDKQYNQGDSYLQVPLQATNTFDTGNPNLGVVIQNSEVLTPDEAISYMLYKGKPDADPQDGKKVPIGTDWNQQNAEDFVMNGRTDTSSPLDGPLSYTFKPGTLPDTSNRGNATIVVIVETARGEKKEITVNIVIANDDPIPVFKIENLIKNTTQNLGFSKNQNAKIKDQLTLQAKITKGIDGSIWNNPVITMTVPDGVELPTEGAISLNDGVNAIATTSINITADRKITATLAQSVTSTTPIYLSFDTKVLDNALGQIYTSTVEISGQDSNQDIVTGTDTSQLTVLDYESPTITLEPKIEKQLPDGISWEENSNVKPGNTVRFTIQSTLNNDYTIWKNQKIVVTIPNGLDTIQIIPDKAVIVRPGQPDIEVTPDSLTQFSKVGNQIIFETNDPQYQFMAANSRIRFSYTANVMIDAVAIAQVKTSVQVSGLNSRDEAVSIPEQFMTLNVTEGKLDFKASPTIDFGTNDLISTGSVIRNPTENFAVNITDTRGTANSGWKIFAEISRPFTSTNGRSTLNGEIIFVDKENKRHVLNNGFTPVHENTSPLTSQPITWENSAGQGLFLNQRAGLNLTGTSYSGEITWTLSEGP
ncbi:WxL domain-containing protein [Carnobacterium gallinarum]|uniref:WxL domain-containing protein n=1 Tax=Carnobacterium gallinarum TaxID=2749 RepID=UPI0005572074|nr:WxL domain-containing protein [Carnobacterium gallinarum]